MEIQRGSWVDNAQQTNQPSGGMEVEIVLATDMWQILTFPFLLSQHYLDREGSVALILPIGITKGVAQHLSPGNSGQGEAEG